LQHNTCARSLRWVHNCFGSAGTPSDTPSQSAKQTSQRLGFTHRVEPSFNIFLCVVCWTKYWKKENIYLLTGSGLYRPSLAALTVLAVRKGGWTFVPSLPESSNLTKIGKKDDVISNEGKKRGLALYECSERTFFVSTYFFFFITSFCVCPAFWSYLLVNQTSIKKYYFSLTIPIHVFFMLLVIENS
jgi:hypothetical protein